LLEAVGGLGGRNRAVETGMRMAQFCNSSLDDILE
jgi:hypothetical protein